MSDRERPDKDNLPELLPSLRAAIDRIGERAEKMSNIQMKKDSDENQEILALFEEALRKVREAQNMGEEIQVHYSYKHGSSGKLYTVRITVDEIFNEPNGPS